MAKLNSEDHKVFDIGAKIVKGALIVGTFIGSVFLGKAALDLKNGNTDDDYDNDNDDLDDDMV